MSVRVTIDRLVVDGLALAPAERARMVAAVEAGIADHVARAGWTAGLGGGLAAHRLDAPALTLPHGLGGAELGARIAAALCDSLTEAKR